MNCGSVNGMNTYVIIAVVSSRLIIAVAKIARKKISGLQRDSHPWPLRSRCSALPLTYEDPNSGMQANLFILVWSLNLIANSTSNKLTASLAELLRQLFVNTSTQLSYECTITRRK